MGNVFLGKDELTAPFWGWGPGALGMQMENFAEKLKPYNFAPFWGETARVFFLPQTFSHPPKRLDLGKIWAPQIFSKNSFP